MGFGAKAAVAWKLVIVRRTLLAGLSAVALASCMCVGNDCEESPADPNALHLSIDQPTRDSTYTTAEDSVFLQGSMDPAAAAVSWTRDGGIATPAFMAGGGLHECYIDGNRYLCGESTYWWASVPLHVGINVIDVTAQDGRGNRGQATISVTRTTDVTPPTVSSTNPAMGASGVATNYSIVATFSESMDATTITPATFQLMDSSGNAVMGTVTVAGRGATFQPSSSLVALTSYTATVTTGVKDLAGNAMQVPATWAFTTGVAPDTTPPSVSSTSPSSGSSCIDTDAAVTVTFDEDVNTATVNSSTFTLKDAVQNSVVGAVLAFNGRSFGLAPASSLSFSTTYTATLAAGIRDLAGNATTANFSWNFTTPTDGIGAWQSISQTSAPRGGETAVWTGTEMIVWGGLVNGGYLRTGGRYRPASDTWVEMASAGAPSPRFGHTAMWTDSEMIVWGGEGGENDFRGLLDGAIYNPVTDAWRSMSSVGAVHRTRFTAVWTGTEMITLDPYNGARYNVRRDSWSPVPLPPLPTPWEFSSIWTGSRMIVLANYPIGCDNVSSPCSLGGAAYDPVTNTWSLISNTGAPSPRFGYATAWTGTEMAVWGGTMVAGSAQGLNTGALYNPYTDTWRPMSANCRLSGRVGHSAVWDGSEVIVWGGYTSRVSPREIQLKALVTGARYNPATDSWQQVITAGAPSLPLGYHALWSGTNMIVWSNGIGAQYQP